LPVSFVLYFLCLGAPGILLGLRNKMPHLLLLRFQRSADQRAAVVMLERARAESTAVSVPLAEKAAHPQLGSAKLQ